MLDSTEQVTVLGFMTMEPGTEETLLKEIDELVRKTRAEPGCVNYDYHRSNDDPNRYVFYENFADQAAFDFHFAQPYTRNWIAISERHGARFDIQFWTMLSDPDRQSNS